MSGSVSLSYKLFGVDVSASKALHGVGKAAGGLGKSLGSMGKIAGGVFAGLSLQSLSRDAVNFGKDSMQAFAETGSQVMALQRVAGGTAEQMSHLAAAAKMTGTDTEVLQKSIGLLAKNMSGPGAKAFQGLGIATRDSQGHLRSFADVMPQLADKFAKMPAGADKTALALKLFGKQGLSMLPILNKGSKGLDEIAKASDEAGTTLGGKDLEAVKANNKAKREFAQTVQGLQIAIGRNLYPVLTQLMNTMKTSVMPVIKRASAFFMEHQGVLLKVAAAIGIGMIAIKGIGIAMNVASGLVRAWTLATTIASAVTKGFGLAQAALNVILSMNPIGLIVIAIVAFIAILVLAYNKVGWFRDLVNGAWEKIKAVASVVWAGIQAAVSGVVSWFATTAWPRIQAVIGFIAAGFRFWWGVVSAVIGWILGRISSFVSWFTGTALPVIRRVVGFIASGFTFWWTTVSNVVKWITDKVTAMVRFFGGIKDKISSAVSGAWDGLKNGFKAALNWIIDRWNSMPSFTIGGGDFMGKTLPSVTFALPHLPHLANGGLIARGGLATVGERGRENVYLPGGAVVAPHGSSPFGTTYELHLHGGVFLGTTRAAAGRELLGAIQEASRGGRVSIAGVRA